MTPPTPTRTPTRPRMTDDEDDKDDEADDIDGAEAARFCKEVIRLLENPDRLMLEAM